MNSFKFNKVSQSLILAFAIGSTSLVSYADDDATYNTTNNNTTNNSTTNNNTVANSHATAKSNQLQGQLQEQLQGQTLSNNNSVSGGNYTESRKAVNTAYAPSIPSTVNCAVPVVGGFSVIGFSVSAGSVYLDDSCVLSQEVRDVALVMKDITTAEQMMCAKASYRKARVQTGRPCKID